MTDHAAAIAAATKCLDDFMAAFNARDPDAHVKTFNFPSVRFASGKMVILNKDDFTPQRYQTEALKEWDHSKWERRNVVHAGADKVHFDTRFTLRHPLHPLSQGWQRDRRLRFDLHRHM